MLKVLKEAFQENKKEFAAGLAIILGITLLYVFLSCLDSYN